MAQGRGREQRLQEEDSMSSIDTVPADPPPEVLNQMEEAARTYERLSDQGRELRFARDTYGGRARIEVRDRSGAVLRTLSTAQALAVAAGTPLDSLDTLEAAGHLHTPAVAAGVPLE
jgi:hypothetical protein